MNKLLENVEESKFIHHRAGRIDVFPKMPTHVDQIALSATSVTYTIPTDARWLIFSPQAGIEFAVKADADAVYPAAAITDGSGSLLNPAQLDVSGLTSLGIISNESGFLSIAVYG